MEITFQYFDGCPHWQTTHQRLREAIGERDDVELVMQVVETLEQAEAVGFRGSPTILVDGVDLLAHGAAPVAGTLACRVYATDDGSPTVEQLHDAVSSQQR